jgi:hypothetical protein
MKLMYITGILAIVVSFTSCNDSGELDNPATNETFVQKAELLIDAFYSFDPSQLTPFLENAQESAPSIIYYQGWAEGGNYKVLDRKPCMLIDPDRVECSITVEDDPVLALGTDYKVTDTFGILFENGEIISVDTSSDDQQIYYDAQDWVRANLPELIEIPCRGFFNGGPTPGDCARVMAEGYAQFTASDDFPGL